jgi:hypothetical protein
MSSHTSDSIEENNSPNPIILPEDEIISKESVDEIESVDITQTQNEHIKFKEESQKIIPFESIVINVTDPKVVGKNISSWVEYTITGTDELGSFECVKR